MQRLFLRFTFYFLLAGSLYCFACSGLGFLQKTEPEAKPGVGNSLASIEKIDSVSTSPQIADQEDLIHRRLHNLNQILKTNFMPGEDRRKPIEETRGLNVGQLPPPPPPPLPKN